MLTVLTFLISQHLSPEYIERDTEHNKNLTDILNLDSYPKLKQKKITFYCNPFPKYVSMFLEFGLATNVEGQPLFQVCPMKMLKVLYRKREVHWQKRLQD